MYCDISGNIFSFLTNILQKLIFPQSIIILITFFASEIFVYCDKNFPKILFCNS